MYKNIIFDVGEVLLSYRWVDALAQAGTKYEDAMVIGPKLFNSPHWAELDLGVRPYFDVVEDLAKEAPGYEDAVRKFLTDVENMLIGRPKVWKEVHRLKEKGYKIYLLSNYSEYMFTRHTADKPFIKDIDGAMVSYMVNINKPDKGIYEALLNKYDLDPSECIFFDDRKENTDGALLCGIAAVTVTGEDMLIEELKKL